jgi:hypothetical protein
MVPKKNWTQGLIAITNLGWNNQIYYLCTYSFLSSSWKIFSQHTSPGADFFAMEDNPPTLYQLKHIYWSRLLQLRPSRNICRLVQLRQQILELLQSESVRQHVRVGGTHITQTEMNKRNPNFDLAIEALGAPRWKVMTTKNDPSPLLSSLPGLSSPSLHTYGSTEIIWGRASAAGVRQRGPAPPRAAAASHSSLRGCMHPGRASGSRSAGRTACSLIWFGKNVPVSIAEKINQHQEW